MFGFFTDDFRFSSRSATATPTGSPKKRQLPLIPAALKERAAQDLEERARFIRHRNRQVHTTYRSTGIGGEGPAFPSISLAPRRGANRRGGEGVINSKVLEYLSRYEDGNGTSVKIRAAN